MKAIKAEVHNRGSAPDSFLDELVSWGRSAPAEIFAPNRVPVDAYTVIKSSLATPIFPFEKDCGIFNWDSALHRRAAMLELMRVHAGLESSWNWKEGVDRTNESSMRSKTGQETGIFQVSFDSTWLDSIEGQDIMGVFVKNNGIETPSLFIPAMKQEHSLALEYYARLVRVSIAWAGPLLRHGADSVYPWLSREAMREFMELLG